MTDGPNAEQKPATLFLSYARADRAWAEKLADALNEAGYTIWWDALIEGGVQFAASIRQALESADAVVVLWSRHSVESDWVRDEAAVGRERHKLVPLSLDGTPPPLGFGQYQAINLSHGRGRTDRKELAAIERAIALVAGQSLALPTEAHRISRRALLVAGSGAGALAIGGGALFAWQRGLIGPKAIADLSIAVLPFRNISDDPAQAYLSDGLTEEVRSALSRNAALMVLATTSSNTVRDHAGDAVSIARKLGVAYLLEGSVQRAGDRVRVAANLTNGKTGFNEWSQRVERPLDDIFAFENEIARTVSNALSVQIATDAPAPGGTRNVRAYEAYLRGKALYNLTKDEETDRQARAQFENAIAADPNFALAHAALSRVLASIASSQASAADIKPTYAAAIAEARKAVELAPSLAEGQLALGYSLFAGRLDVKGARQPYDLAYRYGRGNADILLLYASYTARTRRFAEAKAAIERAVALDPLNPRSHRAAGTISYAARDYDDAIGHLRRALELNPAMTNANATLGNALMEQGKLKEARTALTAEKSAMFRLTGLAVLEHRAGNRQAAQAAYDSLVREVGDAALYQQAEVMAQWGRPDEAINLLHKAQTVGDSGLTLVASDPMLDPLARDPRFRAFVREIGFA
jgi:TolB-like protein/Flp pilus assembly protein TadD